MHASHWTAAAVVAVVLFSAPAADAHFVWIKAMHTDGALQMHAGFGEPGAFDVEHVEKIAAAQFFLRDAVGKTTSITPTLDKEKGRYSADVPGAGPHAVYGSLDYGVVSRTKPGFLLTYHAKGL
ncbi:MAG: hypothetical protein ACRDD1_04695, partial [Planctomycetia bacterium]